MRRLAKPSQEVVVIGDAVRAGKHCLHVPMGKEKRRAMTEKPTDAKKGPGLEGQKSGEGGIRVADAAVATDKQPYAQPGGELENLKVLDGETATVLVSVTRAMYPHDRIPDKHYARVVASLDEKAAADEEMKALLVQGIGMLATVTGRWPREFGELDEAEQVKALKRLEETAFFKAVAGEVVSGLYSQPDIWPYFGYEGPSNDKGGYIHRGFDDIDWLDEAPDRRRSKVEQRIGTEERISKEG